MEPARTILIVASKRDPVMSMLRAMNVFDVVFMQDNNSLD